MMCSHNCSALVNDDNLLINKGSENNREYNLTTLTKGDCFFILRQFKIERVLLIWMNI